MKKTIFALCFLALSLSAAQPFVLVKDGKAAAAICVAKTEPPAVRRAAKELALNALKLTGADVKITSQAPSGAALILTSGSDLPESLKADYEALKKTGSDGYSFRIAGDKAYLFAANAKGVLNGVNRLLRLNTKLIYVRPSVPEPVCTRVRDLVFAEKGLDIPSYYFRTLPFNPASDPAQGVHMARWNIHPRVIRPQDAKLHGKRLLELGYGETYYNPYSVAHNMVSFWMPVAEYGKTHPEYYMLTDGKRVIKKHSHPCVGNPEVRKFFRERAREIATKLPKEYTEIGLMMEDTNLRCECPFCTAPIQLPDGTVVEKTDPAYFSTLFMRLFNEAAKEIAAVRPDLTMLVFGYYALAIPPKVAIEPNIKINWCPYPRDMKQSLFFGDHNAKWRRYFDGYTQKSGRLVLREYYYCGNQQFPRPLLDVAVRDLRYAHEKGVRQYYSDFHGEDKIKKGKKAEFSSAEFWDLNASEVWLLSELLWDVSGDPRELRHEFLRRAYPQGGAEHMIRFYDLIDDSWVQSSASSSYNDDSVAASARYIVGAKLTEPCRKALAEALKAEKHPAARKQIERASALFEKLVKLAERGQVPELVVPETRKGEAIDWSKQPQITPFGLLKAPKRPGGTKIGARVACDNSAWYFRFDITKTPDAPVSVPAKRLDTAEPFASGDHVELSFENEKIGFYQLAVNADGTRWDSRSGDVSWNGDWSAEVKKEKNSWQLTVKVPFATIGFEPLQRDWVRTGVMVTGIKADGRSEHQCWGACRPQCPDSWNKLKMQLQL